MEFYADIIKKSDQKPFGVQARRRLWYTFPGILNDKKCNEEGGYQTDFSFQNDTRPH